MAPNMVKVVIENGKRKLSGDWTVEAAEDEPAIIGNGVIEQLAYAIDMDIINKMPIDTMARLNMSTKDISIEFINKLKRNRYATIEDKEKLKSIRKWMKSIGISNLENPEHVVMYKLKFVETTNVAQD